MLLPSQIIFRQNIQHNKTFKEINKIIFLSARSKAILFTLFLKEVFLQSIKETFLPSIKESLLPKKMVLSLFPIHSIFFKLSPKIFKFRFLPTSNEPTIFLLIPTKIQIKRPKFQFLLCPNKLFLLPLP